MHSMLLRRSLSNLRGPGKNYNILVVGGGIAGPALALLLHRYGMKPVVVERAPELRLSGQWVDLQADGKEVASRMGIEKKIRETITEAQGVYIIDSAGRPQASLGPNDFGEEVAAEEMEVRRPALAKVLYEHIRNDVEFVFGDAPRVIDDRGDRVQVTFASGKLCEFDLVVGADGIHSKTRRLVFGNQSPISYANMYVTYFTIPRTESDGDWVRFYNVPGGRSVALRPENPDKTQVYLCFRSKERGYEKLDLEMQKRLIQKLFADAGCEASRILRELPNLDDFYLDTVGQVKMDRWSKGRVTLVGDAGYCPSPLTGMGANVAIVGAYILAGELSRHQDYNEAFKQYEAWMRPYVTKAQKIIPGTVRVALPNSPTMIALRNAVFGLVLRPTITRFAAKLFTSKTPPKSLLPNYEPISTP